MTITIHPDAEEDVAEAAAFYAELAMFLAGIIGPGGRSREASHLRLHSVYRPGARQDLAALGRLHRPHRRAGEPLR